MQAVIVRTLVLSTLLTGCSGALTAKARPVPSDAGADAAVQVDTTEIVKGVPDNGRDPAVVAIDVGGEGLCSGTLIATDVVLTARHCVSITSESVACPADGVQISGDRPASSLAIYVGDDVEHSTFVARGRELVVPKAKTLCDHDIAAIVLDRDVAGIAPLHISKKVPRKNGTVRAVGFGKAGDLQSAGVKLLRDHVRILSATDSEFQVGEATCNGDSGGPALEESTGDVMGVVSRGGPSCEGKDVHNIYTRADAFADLIASALAKSGQEPADTDGGVVTVKKDAGVKPPKQQKPESDMGEPCEKGADCAAGVCVDDSGDKYCSRPCGHGDRCPNGYWCTHVGDTDVCVAH